MRIIAGTLKGRNFDSPGSRRTHPMSDKMRGALFNILGDLAGMTVLDAFGGSGALGLEALSRGAANVLVIEEDRAAQRTIEQNIRGLGLQTQARLVKAHADAWLRTNLDQQFSLILCDPPYDDLQPQLLTALSQRTAPGGLFVLSYPGLETPPTFAGLVQLKQQSYGNGQLVFYRPGNP